MAGSHGEQAGKNKCDERLQWQSATNYYIPSWRHASKVLKICTCRRRPSKRTSVISLVNYIYFSSFFSATQMRARHGNARLCKNINVHFAVGWTKATCVCVTWLPMASAYMKNSMCRLFALILPLFVFRLPQLSCACIYVNLHHKASFRRTNSLVDYHFVR